MNNTSQKPFHCIITGGLGGIGQALVVAFLERQKQQPGLLFVFDCLPECDERAQALEQQGVIYLCVQLASIEHIKDAFKKVYAIIEQQFPGSNLSLLVNNAGITKDALALRVKESDWDNVLDVNLKASFFCAQQALSSMIKNQGGYIISMSSVVALTGNPGQVNYAASKAGVIAMSKTLAQEYASRNVLCNVIAPGFIATPMTNKLSEEVKSKILSQIPLGRFGKPQDVAELVLFLSSGKADYITGQVFTLDGGLVP
jgi:3-oxoacyl-[acyl-carrier protein] reductase